jgi:hypothetical protein
MRTQNKPRHQSAVTREDFCCGFWVIFGRRLVFVLVLSMGTGATDADGSAVATVGVSSDMLLIGHGVASLMRLAIVWSTSSGGLSLVRTKSNPGEITNVCKVGSSAEISSVAKALDAPAKRATAAKTSEAQLQVRLMGGSLGPC